MSDVLVCPRVADNPQGYIIPGTVEGVCAQCGSKVRIAPSGQELIRVHGPTVLCTSCARAAMSGANPEIMPITNNQLEELKGYLKRN